MLLNNNEITLSIYEANKTMVALGLEYEKYMHVLLIAFCIEKNTRICLLVPLVVSKWKSTKKSKGIPAKIVWYFPPILRFKRIFQSP